MDPAAAPPVTAAGPLARHVERDVRLWLGLGAESPVEPPSLPARLARRLLRLEEVERPHRDRWDNFEYGYAESFWEGRLLVPEIDAWASRIREELSARVALEPLWPDGHRFVLCPTHDVDMVSRQRTPAQAARAVRSAARPVHAGANVDRVIRPLRAVASAGWFGVSRAPSARETLERCVGIERDLGVSGSYLFTVLPARSTPYDCVYAAQDRCRFRGAPSTVAAIVGTLADEGCDIGLHGSYGSALDARVLREERERLEDMAGRPVTSTRQHYLHFDAARTPAVQAASGLRTDSTVGFNRSVGFRAGTSLPHHQIDLPQARGLDLLEIPLIVQEAALVAANALELDGELARRAVARLIDAVAAVEGVATILVHPHSLLDPRVLDLYRFSLEYGLERGAWVVPLAEIDRWWRARERRVLGAAAP